MRYHVARDRYYTFPIAIIKLTTALIKLACAIM
jgi:hypothetical protein